MSTRTSREVGIQLVEERYEYAEEFEFGLDLIVDGLAGRQQQSTR